MGKSTSSVLRTHVSPSWNFRLLSTPLPPADANNSAPHHSRVPALEDPNTSITAWESGAIISYLLRQYDVSHRFSPSPSWTAQQSVDFDTWIAFLLSTLGPMTGQTNWYRHYNAVKNDDALKRFGEQTRRCYGVVEGQLRAAEGGEGGILGQGINAVDWHFYPWVKQHEYAGLSIDEFPLLKKWKLAMEEREEVKRAYGKVEAGENVSA
jgi:glutathione S-transferase